MTRDGSRPPANMSSLEAELRRIAREEADAAIRRITRDLPGSRPEWTTLARYARSCGFGVSTLRRWARGAGLQRGPAGRFRTTALEELIRFGGNPRPPSPPADLAAVRARRAADSLTKRGRP